MWVIENASRVQEWRCQSLVWWGAGETGPSQYFFGWRLGTMNFTMNRLQPNNVNEYKLHKHED